MVNEDSDDSQERGSVGRIQASQDGYLLAPVPRRARHLCVDALWTPLCDKTEPPLPPTPL